MRRPVPSTSPRALRAFCLGALAFAAAVSCSSAKDTESEVPASPGAVQPETNGKLLEEADACSELTEAEADARAQLKCDKVERTCPDYIRPAAGEACFKYDQGSVRGCAKLFETFTSCDDFDAHPCLPTAVSSCTDAAGGAAGSSAEGGAGGVAPALAAAAGAGG